MERNNNQDYRYVVTETPSRNGKKSSGLGKTAAVVLSCILIGGAFGVGGVAAYSKKNAEAAAPEAWEETVLPENVLSEAKAEKQEARVAYVQPLAATNAAVSANRKLMTASEVYEQYVNSTVGITTSINTNFFGYRTTAAAAGSGFIITPDGYIVTNYHVIEDSTSISVALYDGTTYDAELVGVDESNDVAVLKVDAQNLVPVTFGDSSLTLVGEDVVAIGNPLGELTFSLTKGVISALDREVTLSNGVTMNLMQTDCAINSGNSGGALFNLYGEVIGITNAKYSSSGFTGEASIDNIGFAIPVNSVMSIVKSLMENGYVSKPYIGVSVGDVSDDMQKYGLPAGASIESVTEGSAAEAAGLQANDIVIEANGEAITSGSDLSKVVSASAVGDKLKLKVYRQGETLELTVTVGEKVQTVESAAGKNGSSGKHDSQKPKNGEYDSYDGYEDYDEYEDYGGFGDLFGDLFGYGDEYDDYDDYDEYGDYDDYGDLFGDLFGFGGDKYDDYDGYDDYDEYDDYGDLFGFGGDGGSLFDWFFGSGNSSESGNGSRGGRNT